VHRLLGMNPATGRSRHHQDAPLPLDVLVVDEASMLDLELATRLFEAMPPAARIVLLGDKDQLAAVESGAVFAELSADPTLGQPCREALAQAAGCDAEPLQPPAPSRRSALQDTTVWFDRNYRFDHASGIGRAAAAIREGRAEDLLGLLRTGGSPDLHWLERSPSAGETATVHAMRAGYSAFVEALQRDPGDVVAVSRAFAGFRVLCATREGPQGVRTINEQLSEHLRRALGHAAPAGARWFVGQPLIVLRNDPILRLFNGDIGLVLPGAGGEPVAMFAAGDAWRAIPPLRLPEHDTAFAMTVHKSQGSEFDEVLVLLPDRPSRVATRELLYTADTRARRGVTLAATQASVVAAVARPTRRDSGLLDRLREALQPAGEPGAATAAAPGASP